MSINHDVTFRCDACDQNFTIDEETMDLPPSWLGMQIMIADLDGCLPDRDVELVCHFCSQDCLVEYSSSEEMRQKLILVASSTDDEEDS